MRLATAYITLAPSHLSAGGRPLSDVAPVNGGSAPGEALGVYLAALVGGQPWWYGGEEDFLPVGQSILWPFLAVVGGLLGDAAGSRVGPRRHAA